MVGHVVLEVPVLLTVEPVAGEAAIEFGLDGVEVPIGVALDIALPTTLERSECLVVGGHLEGAGSEREREREQSETSHTVVVGDRGRNLKW